MGKWTVEYYNGAAWTPLTGVQLNSIDEVLNEHEEAGFKILNTQANRNFVATDRMIRMNYDGKVVYEGILKAFNLSLTDITCIVYNPLHEYLQRREYTAKWANTPAQTILNDIIGVTGGTVGDQFGYAGTATYNFLDYCPVGFMDSCKIQMNNRTGATVTNISIKIGTDASLINAKCAIYSDVNGYPSAKLGESDTVFIYNSPSWDGNSNNSWVNFPFSTPVSVEPLKFYWVFWMASDTIKYPSYVTGGGVMTHCWYDATLASGFPATLSPEPIGYGDWMDAVLCTLSIGVNLGNCPTTLLSMEFERKNSYEAAVSVGTNLNLDNWTSGDLFYIGVRDSCKLAVTFDEGAGNTIYDYSGYANNLTLQPPLNEVTIGNRTTGTAERNCAAGSRVASAFSCSATNRVHTIKARVKRAVSTVIPLFADNLESGGLTNWTGADTTYAPAASQTVVKNDAWSLRGRLTAGLNSEWSGCWKQLSGIGSPNPVYVGAWVNFTQPPDTTAESQFALAITNATGGTGVAYVGITNSSGTLYWRTMTWAASTLGTHTSTTQFTSGWHYVELGAYIHASDGWYKVWVDGTEIADLTQTGVNSTGRIPNYVRAGFSYSHAQSGATTYVYLDDISIANTYIPYPNASLSTVNVRASIYADSAGNPDTLLASSSNVAVGTSYTWVTFSFDTQPVINAGSTYWLALTGDGEYQVRYQDGLGSINICTSPDTPPVTASTYGGFSAYLDFSSGYLTSYSSYGLIPKAGLDWLITQMTNRSFNCFRMSFRPSWLTSSNHYYDSKGVASIQYLLDNTDWLIVVDGNHVWGGSSQNTACLEAHNHLQDMIDRCLSICASFPNNPRVAIELVNEYIPYNFSITADITAMINAIRGAGYTNPIVMDRHYWSSYSSTYTQIKTAIDAATNPEPFYTGAHYYFDYQTVSFCQTDLNTATSRGLKTICTEIGASSAELPYTQTQIDNLEAVWEWASERGHSLLIWLNNITSSGSVNITGNGGYLKESNGTARTNPLTVSPPISNPFGNITTTETNKQLCIYCVGVGSDTGDTTPLWDVGRYGGALTFRSAWGTRAENTACSGLPTGAGDHFTIIQWIYLSDAETDGAVFSCLGSTGKRIITQLDGYIAFSYGTGQVTTSTPFSVGVWQMIAVTAGASTISIYKGVQGGNLTLIGQTGRIEYPVANQTFAIGRIPSGNTTGWHTPNFLSDETFVYNKEMSIAELSFYLNCQPHACNRLCDRSKRRNRVICRGVDRAGNIIEQEAGKGEDTTVITKLNPSDEATLLALAQAALAQLDTDTQGAPITVPIYVGANWTVGDAIPIHIPQLMMDGIYRIQKTTKKPKEVTAEVERPKVILDNILKQLKDSSVEQLANRAGVRFTRSAEAPPNPQAGDMWLDSDSIPPTYYYYDGAKWATFNSSGTGAQVSLTILANPYCTINPSVGTYTYAVGTVVTLKCTNIQAGYQFSYWKVDDSNAGTGTGADYTYSLTMDVNHTVQPVIVSQSQIVETTTTIGSTSSGTLLTLGNMITNKIRPTANGTITSLGINVQTAAGNIQLALYSDSGGEPNAKLAVTNSVAAVTGWNDIPVTVAGVTVSASSDYWIVIQLTNIDLAVYYSPSGSLKYVANTYGSFPATFGTATNQSGFILNFRMKCQSQGTITPPTGGGGSGNGSALTVVSNLIKDSANNTVILRGIGEYGFAPDMTSFFGEGNFAQYANQWHATGDEQIRQHFNCLRNVWGVNMVRVFYYPSWFLRQYITPAYESSWYGWDTSAIDVRAWMVNVCNIAAEFGMYVLWSPYTLVPSNGSFDLDPYASATVPPNGWEGMPMCGWTAGCPSARFIQDSGYSADAGNSERAFWSMFWTAVGDTFKNTPNALIDLWNEPGEGALENGWKDFANTAYSALRARGCSNLLVIQWRMGWMPNGWGDDFAWCNAIQTYITSTSGSCTNVVYSSHAYYHAPTDLSAYWGTNLAQNSLVDDITNGALGTMGGSYPLIWTECGSCLYSSGNWNQDFLWWDAFNYACDQLGLGVTAYYWGGGASYGGVIPSDEGLLDGQGYWQSGTSGPTPNEMGSIFLNYKNASIPSITDQKTLTILSNAGLGTISPSVGAHGYDIDSSTSITCTPASNYTFSHWMRGISSTNMTVYGNSMPLVLTMDNNYVIQPVFTYTGTGTPPPSGGGGGVTSILAGGSWSSIGHIADQPVTGNFRVTPNGTSVPDFDPPATGNSWDAGGAYIMHNRWTLPTNVDLSAYPVIAFDLWVDNVIDISVNVTDLSFASVWGTYIVNTIASLGSDIIPSGWTQTIVNGWRVLHCPANTYTHFEIPISSANLASIGILDISVDCETQLPMNVKIHNLCVKSSLGTSGTIVSGAGSQEGSTSPPPTPPPSGGLYYTGYETTDTIPIPTTGGGGTAQVATSGQHSGLRCGKYVTDGGAGSYAYGQTTFSEKAVVTLDCYLRLEGALDGDLTLFWIAGLDDSSTGETIQFGLQNNGGASGKAYWVMRKWSSGGGQEFYGTEVSDIDPVFNGSPWRHIQFTRNNTTGSHSLYVDGVLKIQHSFSAMGTSCSRAQFGIQNNVSGAWLGVYIDDVNLSES